MDIAHFFKRGLKLFGRIFMIGSSVLVGLVLLLFAVGTMIDGKNGGGGEPARQEAENAAEDLPVWKQYENVADFHHVVEEAWKDRAYRGIPLEIYDPGLFELVVVALEMMRKEASYEYNYVADATAKIVQAKRTYASGGVTYIRPHDVAAGVLLTAGTLYHEATHHNQKPGADRIESELEAIANEAELMRALDAPKKLIRWLEQQDGNHGDVDSDGRRTISDFFMQDW